MEIQELYELMDRFRRSGIGKMEFSTGECTVKLEMPEGIRTQIQPQPQVQAMPEAEQVPEEGMPGKGTFVRSPLVGTFYAAPSEDSEPYVKAGDRVKKGQTLCIVEAMKMMNEVPAPCDCVVEEVLKANEGAVGFEEPLFRIREM